MKAAEVADAAAVRGAGPDTRPAAEAQPGSLTEVAVADWSAAV
ncbi:hypothetical protein ACIF70_13155 [Actinacidiphila glaucinigra]